MIEAIRRGARFHTPVFQTWLNAVVAEEIAMGGTGKEVPVSAVANYQDHKDADRKVPGLAVLLKDYLACGGNADSWYAKDIRSELEQALVREQQTDRAFPEPVQAATMGTPHKTIDELIG
ncbi:hypothetical protein HY950_02980 [Candidatus Gottesmanbacteria bacterium]|nr:hypothetical protein [Candidatus Gottesmanbacteria bacterium]